MLLDHGAEVNAKENLRGTTPLMWAADEGHAPAIQLLIQRGADIKAQSDLAERGRGPALGKSNDPRRQVAAQGAALAAGQALSLWTSAAYAATRTVLGQQPEPDVAALRAGVARRRARRWPRRPRWWPRRSRRSGAGAGAAGADRRRTDQTDDGAAAAGSAVAGGAATAP